MWFKDIKYFKEPKNYEKDDMQTWLLELVETVSDTNEITISAEMLDASIRSSASKL